MHSGSCLKMALHQGTGSFRYQVLQLVLGEGELGYDHYFCTIILSLVCLVPPLHHEAGQSKTGHLWQNYSRYHLGTYLQHLNEADFFLAFGAYSGLHACKRS